VSTNATPYENRDVLPLPPERRTWTRRTFVFFWLSTAINIAEWSAASTSLAIGLTVGQALAAQNNIYSITICLIISGQAGGKWHVPFAIINRTGWGLRGSWFVVVNRIILSCCWYGVGGWYGGEMVKIMIGAIWPSFYNMKNHFPANASMKTNEFVSFIIFWVISLPIFFVRPERYRIPAVISSIIVTVAAFAIFIWALAEQGNIGPLWTHPENETGQERLSGSKLSWAMMYMITRGVAGWAGGILYQSDFSRYAQRPGDQIWGQVFVIPICLFGSNLLGIIATSCARGLYPEEPLLWKLYDLLEAIQKHGGNGSRAAVFFAAFAFFLSQICMNVVSCGVVGGMDLAALLPRYITIRRGSFIIAAVGIVINPWKFLNTANSFITAISAYAVFLGPLTGIMFAEYHILRRRRIKLAHLFLPSNQSDYWFWHGLNWKAPVAWVLGVFPSMPGFSAAVTPTKIHVGLGWTHVYYISWFLGFFISGAVWLTLNVIWPPRGLEEIDDENVYGTFGVGKMSVTSSMEGEGLPEKEKMSSDPKETRGGVNVKEFLSHTC
ncbi:Allantoin permease, partial [Leucoagaricus sp. SymC.cos]